MSRAQYTIPLLECSPSTPSHPITPPLQVAHAIDSSNEPRGYTHISEGLKVGLEVMDGDGKRAGARRVSEL
jgi:hypothetical protein